MRPKAKVSGLNAAANDRILSITVTRTTQGKSDKTTIRLDDRDYRLEWPAKGKVITVEMGYIETGLVLMGTFEIDLVRHGDEQAAYMEITANAQSHANSNVTGRIQQPWDEKTISTIVGTIASRNGYAPQVDPAVAGFFYDHLQQNESDAHFLQRIAVSHDCYVKYENGKLIFWKRDNPLGSVTVHRGTGDPTATALTFSLNARNEFDCVKAQWRNRDDNKTYYETVGGGKKVKTLPRVFANKQEAQEMAQAEFSRLSRGTGTIDSMVIPGEPNVASGLLLNLVGFRPEACAIQWKITEDVHTIDSGGYKTSVKAECTGNA